MNDLSAWLAKGSGELLLGVMGDPIGHSRSPLMQTAALRALGIPGAYVPLLVAPGRLGDAVAAARSLQFRGFNVTIPHKVNVIPYLDRLDERAAAIGAVNTVVNDGETLTGYNTDGIGYVRALKTEAVPELAGKRILVLGAGGAARGVVDALLREEPGELIVANRAADKALALAAEWGQRGALKGIGMNEAHRVVPFMDVIINTTSVGMHPHTGDTPLDAALLREGTVVSDLIYNPLETRLLAEAKTRGCMAHGGLGMFVYQGAYALEYWTGKPAPTDIMRSVILQALGAPDAIDNE